MIVRKLILIQLKIINSNLEKIIEHNQLVTAHYLHDRGNG